VNVTKLRNKPRAIPNVVIKVARLPERLIAGLTLLFFSGLNGDLCLQQLQDIGDCSERRPIHQQVHMFGHHDIPEDTHPKPSSHLFQRAEESIFHAHLCQQWKAVETTERQEVGLSGMVKAHESVGHE
jgi:hypothetical protein